MRADHLLSPVQIGDITLNNRIVMAPLTRLRAHEPGDVPNSALAAEYYAQRADAGLLIAEATQISPVGKGYAGAPGIYNEAQVQAWQPITAAVHAKGGRMALQLWHVGRVSHTSLQPEHAAPVAPSAIAADANATVRNPDGQLGRAPCSLPRALETAEIADLIEDYRQATDRSRRAGFDLVEVHAAHGYLLHQFQSPLANQRTDQYGGSVENRARLTLEVVDAVIGEWDSAHVGIRISPLGIFNGLDDTGQEDMAWYLADELAKRKLAYLHLSEPDWAGAPALSDAFRHTLRARYPGKIIAAGGYTTEKAETLLKAKLIDAVAFGRPFIGNPDLVSRLREDWPLVEFNPATVYAAGAEGYTDYPVYSPA